ncbi:AAA family ATPase [Deinococcus ruber]|nr:AAA family ATPase [Deinococcus ruber]
MFDTTLGFKHKTTSFPGIGKGGNVTIPPSAFSGHIAATKMRNVCWGALEAIGVVLKGHVDACREQDSLTVCIPTGTGDLQLSQSCRAGNQFTWTNPGTTVRPYVVLIAEALLFGTHKEVSERWEHLLNVIRPQATLPLAAATMERLSHDPAVKEALFAMVDSLYFTAKASAVNRPELADPVSPPTAWLHSPVLLGKPPLAATRGAVDLSPAGLLARRSLTGVRALLYGPTGTGKTELAKRIALQNQSALVDIKGRPGLEDRDMIGYIAPSATGPRWVDGPVARAFRMAQQGLRVTLVVDELLRFEPHHRNLFIGLMDDKSDVEVAAVIGSTVPTGRYYTLELPGADEVLYAATSDLNILCTTNVGSNYVQSGDFDPALKRRFQMMLSIGYAPEAEILPLYTRTGGAQAAAVTYALEVATRSMTISQGQLLAEPMNIGVSLNYLQEVHSLVDAGLELADALRSALLVTVAPFCCEFTDQGELDEAAIKSLSTTLEQLLRKAGLAT